MKKTAIRCVAVAALTMLTGAAFAARTGGYVGGGLGYSNFNTPTNLALVGGSAFDKQTSHKVGGVAGRVFSGYNFNPFFGLEAGYAHYAQSQYKYSAQLLPAGTARSSATYKMYSINLVGKAYLPLSDTGFNLYGLGGGALVRSDNVITGFKEQKQTKLRPVYGLGAQYDFPDNPVSTGIEYSRVQGKGNIKTSPSAIPSANLVTFNLAYNFG